MLPRLPPEPSHLGARRHRRHARRTRRKRSDVRRGTSYLCDCVDRLCSHTVASVATHRPASSALALSRCLRLVPRRRHPELCRTRCVFMVRLFFGVRHRAGPPTLQSPRSPRARTGGGDIRIIPDEDCTGSSSHTHTHTHTQDHPYHLAPNNQSLPSLPLVAPAWAPVPPDDTLESHRCKRSVTG